MDSLGNVYVSCSDYTVRRVGAATGAVEVVAGIPGAQSSSSLSSARPAIVANSTALYSPVAVAVDARFNLYVADDVRVLVVNATTGGRSEFSNFTTNALRVGAYLPSGLAVDAPGNVYIADSSQYRLLRIAAATGAISTFVSVNVGYGPGTAVPPSVAVDAAGNVFFAGTFGIKKAAAATGVVTAVTSVKGNLVSFDGSAAVNVTLAEPASVALDARGTMYVCDGRVVNTIQADGSITTRVAVLLDAVRVALDAAGGRLFVTDTSRLCVMNTTLGAGAGACTTIMGGRFFTFYSDLDLVAAGEGVPYASATLGYATSVAVDARGDVFIADESGSQWRGFGGVVRKIDFASGAITTVVGTLNASPGADGDGGPATAARLSRNVACVALDARTGDLYVCDTGNHAIRAVLASGGGVIATVAGTLGSSLGDAGDGGLATRAVLSSPQGISIDALGNLYIADTGHHAIRFVNASTGVITTLAGVVGVPGYSGDGGAAALALLTSPRGVFVDTRAGGGGAVYIADTGNSVVRMIPVAVRPLCPAGYFCSIGRNLSPCVSSTSYCPPNSSAPVPVDAGYVAVSARVPFYPVDAVAAAAVAAQAPVRVSQRACPAGSFCPPDTGATTPCYGGSYGSTPYATAASLCPSCVAGAYLAEAGRTALPDGGSPCLPCPSGTLALAAGSTACALCPPGTQRAGGGATPPQACSACPPGAASLYGAAACFPLLSGDALSLAPGSVSFQRLPAVASGNADAPTLLASTLRVGLPVLAAALVPYALLALAARAPRLPCARALRSALERLDRYNLRPPESRGASPTLHPSPLGGAVSVVAAGLVGALMSSTIVQYLGSNTLLQRSSLPVTLPALAAFRSLPLAPVAPAVVAGLVSAPALAALAAPSAGGGARAGFAVTLATMGSRCGVLRGVNGTSGGSGAGFTASLAAGSFRYSAQFDASTGAALHTFACPDCYVDALSQLVVSLDASCQSALVSVAAASAAGGLSSAQAYVVNPAAPGAPALASVAVTFPLVLEVVQDGVDGAAPRPGDGLVLGGRSTAGLVVLAATGVATTAAASAAEAAAGAALQLTLALPVQPAYTLYQLSPILSILQLLSSLAAWLSVAGVGGVLLKAHRRAAALAARSMRRLGGAASDGAPGKGGGDGHEDDGAGASGARVHPLDAVGAASDEKAGGAGSS